MPFTPLDHGALFSTAFMSGPMPWAVWTAILSTADANGMTSLNPQILARMWGVPVEDVQAAWEVHTKPDPDSKNKEHGGRRIIPVDGRWYIVSHSKYKEMYSPEFRREQLRVAKRRQRARDKGIPVSCKCGEWLANPGDELCPACAFGDSSERA